MKKTIQEQKAQELDEIFQMEEVLTEIYSYQENIGLRLLEYIREIKAEFKQLEKEEDEDSI